MVQKCSVWRQGLVASQFVKQKKKKK